MSARTHSGLSPAALLALLAACASASEGERDLVAPGAALVRLADGFGFTEGPATAPNGDVYFTDQPNDRILRWRVANDDGLAGEVEVFLEGAARANGLAFDGAGRLLTCAEERNELRAIDVETRATSALVRTFDGARLNGPNDLWVHPSGAVYFTDPYYQRAWWTRTASELGTSDVYRAAPATAAPDLRRESGSRAVMRVASDFERPNGIVGTPDGRTLYVSDLGRGETWAFDIAPDGALAGRRLVIALGSDGMALDERGRLYLTGDGVTVVDPRSGEVVAKIPVPESWTANVTFGGRDRRTLFITAKGALYALRMAVRGA